LAGRARNKVLRWSDPTITHYPRAIAITWETSVAQLTNPARRLLERLVWLAPEPVPEFLLDVPVPEDEGEDLYEALADLAAYSLATRDPEELRFLVHGLVQDVTRRSLDAAASQQRITEALGWVNSAFDGDPQDMRNWRRLDPLAPHAQNVTHYADAAEIAEPTAPLMSQLGMLFHCKSLHAQAEPLLRRALAIDEASYGPDHPDVATILNNLAALLRDTGRLAEAEPLFRRALAIHEASLGPDHSTVASGLNNLAHLLQDTNRLAEAEPLTRRALTIGEVSFGPNHPTVAVVLNNLARLLQATNRLPEAEPLYRRALAIDVESFGPDHPKIAIRLNNLAGLLRDTNRLAEAEPLYRRALAIDEASFGPDHPKVARDLNNLAALLRDANRIAEAEPLMRRGMVIFVDFERRTGHPHPHRDAAVRNYADLLATMGKSEAEIKAATASLTGEDGSETLTSRTVFSDLFVVPAKAGTQEKVVKSAALDARFRGHDDQVGG
jgi:tetratricopeptide (TPR) repeat protein